MLKKTVQTQNQPVWNGSFGIPVSEGGYPHYPSTVVAPTGTAIAESTYNWTIEEARIRGGYNNTNVDYGVLAYLVEEEPNASTRKNVSIINTCSRIKYT